MASLEILVLLSGPVAVGKTTLRQALISGHDFDFVRSSGYLRTLAEQRVVEGERTGLQNLGDELDRLTDYRWLIDEVAKPGFDAAPKQKRWLVDAVRKKRQVEHFRSEYGDAVLHVHLNASEQVIRNRYAKRGDPTPYDVVIGHENEASSRKLIDIADLIIDTETIHADEAAHKIISCARKLD